MLGELISFPAWVLGSILGVSLQYGVVLYNAVRIGLDVILFGLTRWLRLVLRNVTWPLPHKIARQYRLFHAHRNLNRVTTYEQWIQAAHEIDREEGLDRWREDCSDQDHTCDHQLLMSTTQTLRRYREDNNAKALMLHLGSVLTRQFGGIENSSLYDKSYVGTKRTVEEFIEEVCRCADFLANASTLSQTTRRTFFEHARLGLGRCALALSGGGALAMYHLGVVKSLIEQGLMPRVVSGTSGGSIVAAMLAMKTDEEMLEEGGNQETEYGFRYGVRWFDSIDTQLMRFIKSILKQESARMMESETFAHTCKAHFGSVTFGEAFKHCGRIVSIPVTARYGTAQNAHPVILNYLTAPHVLLWSAVAASCALPGLMRPVSLIAKNPTTGEEESVYPTGVQFLDGTAHSDIPCEQLTILFHTNRFIVSQVNPHVTPFVRDSGPRSNSSNDSMVVRMLTQYQYWLNLDIQQRTMKLAKLRLLPKFFGQEMRKVFLQRYNGHVTIVPRMSVLDRFKTLSHPERDDMERYIAGGQQATWLHMARIRTLVAIENKLTECSHKFTSYEEYMSPARPLSIAGGMSEEDATQNKPQGTVKSVAQNTSGSSGPNESQNIPSVWGSISVPPNSQIGRSPSVPDVPYVSRYSSVPVQTDTTPIRRPTRNIKVSFRRSGSSASLRDKQVNHRADHLGENSDVQDYTDAVDPLMGGGGLAATDDSYFRIPHVPSYSSYERVASRSSLASVEEDAAEGTVRRVSSAGTLTPPFQEDMYVDDEEEAPSTPFDESSMPKLGKLDSDHHPPLPPSPVGSGSDSETTTE